MSELSPLLALLATLFALWLVATAVVGSLAARRAVGRAERGAAAPLEAEAWLALAASGAAVGGFLGFGGAGVARLGQLGVAPSLLALLACAAVGMLLGATLACGAAALYLERTFSR